MGKRSVAFDGGEGRSRLGIQTGIASAAIAVIAVLGRSAWYAAAVSAVNAYGVTCATTHTHTHTHTPTPARRPHDTLKHHMPPLVGLRLQKTRTSAVHAFVITSYSSTSSDQNLHRPRRHPRRYPHDGGGGGDAPPRHPCHHRHHLCHHLRHHHCPLRDGDDGGGEQFPLVWWWWWWWNLRSHLHPHPSRPHHSLPVSFGGVHDCCRPPTGPVLVYAH